MAVFSKGNVIYDIFGIAIVIFTYSAGISNAACHCTRVNGTVQSICSNSTSVADMRSYDMRDRSSQCAPYRNTKECHLSEPPRAAMNRY
jgi:hypothetical protein